MAPKRKRDSSKTKSRKKTKTITALDALKLKKYLLEQVLKKKKDAKKKASAPVFRGGPRSASIRPPMPDSTMMGRVGELEDILKKIRSGMLEEELKEQKARQAIREAERKEDRLAAMEDRKLALAERAQEREFMIEDRKRKREEEEEDRKRKAEDRKREYRDRDFKHRNAVRDRLKKEAEDRNMMLAGVPIVDMDETMSDKGSIGNQSMQSEAKSQALSIAREIQTNPPKLKKVRKEGKEAADPHMDVEVKSGESVISPYNRKPPKYKTGYKSTEGASVIPILQEADPVVRIEIRNGKAVKIRQSDIDKEIQKENDEKKKAEEEKLKRDEEAAERQTRANMSRINMEMAQISLEKMKQEQKEAERVRKMKETAAIEDAKRLLQETNKDEKAANEIAIDKNLSAAISSDAASNAAAQASALQSQQRKIDKDVFDVKEDKGLKFQVPTREELASAPLGSIGQDLIHTGLAQQVKKLREKMNYQEEDEAPEAQVPAAPSPPPTQVPAATPPPAQVPAATPPPPKAPAQVPVVKQQISLDQLIQNLANTPTGRNIPLAPQPSNTITIGRQVPRTHYFYDPSEQQGPGLKSEYKKGLTTKELDKIMSPYRSQGFMGTVPWDHVKLAKFPPQSRASWIVNLDPAGKPGYHWVALYIDARPKGKQTIEYFDSFAKPIPKGLRKDLLDIQKRMKPVTALQLKENKIVAQHTNTDTCGLHAAAFLKHRYAGHNFKECSGFNEATKREKELKHVPEFKKFLK